MGKIKEYFVEHTTGNLYSALRTIYRGHQRILELPFVLEYYVFGLFSLQNKVVATTFGGRKYGDNPKFILEEIHKMDPEIKLVWLCSKDYPFKIPKYIERASYRDGVQKAYQMATAKVWIDSHRLKTTVRKRKGQLFIETWHGGLGLKKLDADSPKFNQLYTLMREVSITSNYADLFISNSKHLTDIYRTAFRYKGKIWKCGYPKNDILFEDKEKYRQRIRRCFGLAPDMNILVYAPTFRDNFTSDGVNMGVYNIDYPRLRGALRTRFGGDWTIIIRYHPFVVNTVQFKEEHDFVIDGTAYPEIQHLIMAADAFISDYSSCLFDAAILTIPCFTYAIDFEEYKEDRGVYYTMDELPFPYAKNNDILVENILGFDFSSYLRKWREFKEKAGLYETGHAAKDIAYIVTEFIKGNNESINQIETDTYRK